MPIAKDIKVLLIGDNRVGKRQIIVAFAKDGGHKYSTSVVGVESCKDEIDISGRKFKVVLCDTNGTESSAKLITGSYKDVDAVALIYDDLKSFKNLKRWLDDVNQNCDQKVVKMVWYHNRKQKCVVTLQDAKKFAMTGGCIFFEVQEGDKASIKKVICELIPRLSNSYDNSPKTSKVAQQNIYSPPQTQKAKPRKNQNQLSFDDDILVILFESIKEFNEKYIEESNVLKPEVEEEMMANLAKKLQNSSPIKRKRLQEHFQQIIASYRMTTNKFKAAAQVQQHDLSIKTCNLFMECLEISMAEAMKLDSILGYLDTTTAKEIKSGFEKHFCNLQKLIEQLYQPAQKAGLIKYRPSQFLCNQENLLGKGGFASVRLAFHDSLGWVAIKELEYGDGKSLEKCLNESYIAQIATHQNVVKVFGVTEISDCMLGLVMEYMPGGSLSQLIFGKDFKKMDLPDLRLRMFADVASGIAYLHNIFEERRISHNDIKPHNVLMTYELICKISDFGGADLSMRTDLVPDATRHKGSEFTPLFASPERLSKIEKLTKASDVYSYGLTGYCILEGPLDKWGSKEFIGHIKDGRRPSFSHKENRTNESGRTHQLLQEIVESCWKQEPLERPPMLIVRDKLYELMAKMDRIKCLEQVLQAVRILQLKRQDFDKQSLFPLPVRK